MSVIKLFNKAFPGNDVAFNTINKLAVTVGYIVHPECCTKEVLDFLKKQNINYNATFYKSWSNVISKNRFELYLDQIKHYASTYGTDYKESVFIPNDGANQIPFTDLKIILPITKEEANKRSCEMLYSGIALSSDTISMILPLATNVDISLIKNKEALMHFCKLTDSIPTDATEFVRYLIFLATEKTLLIKDKATITALKTSDLPITSIINRFGIEKLSEVFFRFKPIFLALKKKNTKDIINKLRRLANTNHKPMQVGFFESILSDVSLVSQLPEKLLTCSNFKKILLLQTILIRQKELDMRFFGIRNGKLWAKEEKTVNKSYYKIIYDIIYKSLIDSLAKSATSVKIPVGINLTLPTSEKSFIGNYPLGTSFDLSDTDAIVGINWREDNGARDLDLSLIDTTGRKIGWNVRYTNDDKSIVYSGDMTSADPEATELMYASEGFIPSIVKVNLYNGDINSKFKLFLATEKVVNMTSNYMVNPNNVKFTIDCVMDSKEKSVAVITENKLILAQFRTGNRIVSGNSITNKYTEYVLDTLDCYLDLKKVLTDSGFTINSGDEKLDLTNLSKDNLMSLLQI